MHAMHPSLARVDRGPRVGELHFRLSQRLDLATRQNNPGLVGVGQNVTVTSLPIGGDHLNTGLLHRTGKVTTDRRSASGAENRQYVSKKRSRREVQMIPKPRRPH